MIAFHINMTFGHFTAEYLKKWLRILAANGYDTVVWEVEDAVRWDTCPEVAAADAFSKVEFKDILDYAADQGLQAVPLLQTFAHCEYVLRHEAYYHLSEHPEFVELYCPLKLEVKRFLNAWINEYLELFGTDIPCFHLGGDEAWALGGRFCDGACPDYVKNHSKSELYIQHLDALCKPLLKRGIAPAVWADMLLKHGEAVDMLSREVVLFDWQYELRRDVEKVWIWEEARGLTAPHEVPDGLKQKYDRYLPDTFYTTDFLRDQGFAVIGCPASSCYGDNVFAPQTELHLKNTAGWTEKYRSGATRGLFLTSWTAHLFPYEMQLHVIMLPKFMQQHPDASLDDFELEFCRKIFDDDSIDFFAAVKKLDRNCLFSHTSTLGYNAYHRVIPDNHVEQVLRKVDQAAELENCRQRQVEYQEALAQLLELRPRANHGLVELWILQAKNLINRAAISAAILSEADHPSELLRELEQLREETKVMYMNKLKPARAEEVVYWQFDCIRNYWS